MPPELKHVFDGTQVIREKTPGQYECAPATSLTTTTGEWREPPRGDMPWKKHAKELIDLAGVVYSDKPPGGGGGPPQAPDQGLPEVPGEPQPEKTMKAAATAKPLK